jgi:hypothetical protein
VVARRSESHPDSDLSRSVGYLIGQQSIQADRRERDGQRAEDASQPNEQFLSRERARDIIFDWCNDGHDQLRIDVLASGTISANWLIRAV